MSYPFVAIKKAINVAYDSEAQDYDFEPVGDVLHMANHFKGEPRFTSEDAAFRHYLGPKAKKLRNGLWQRGKEFFTSFS